VAILHTGGAFTATSLLSKNVGELSRAELSLSYQCLKSYFEYLQILNCILALTLRKLAKDGSIKGSLREALWNVFAVTTGGRTEAHRGCRGVHKSADL